jgi:large subunit ribosomal protein L21
MFAVLKTGGKQYRVQAGDVLRVEKLAADAGEKVQFNEILMVGSTIGTPLVDDAGVQAEVIDQIKGEKVIHFVKRRRKHGSQRTKGHRQQLTLLRVTDILESGAGKSGVKAALGGSGATVKSDGQYAKNRAEQSEMKKRVATGEAQEKKAETKAAPKAAKAEAGADDLKKLSGVGPALEKKLHEAGVTSFAQIAAWTEEDVAKFDEALSFKGRIEREGWVEQAQAIEAEKE